MIGLKLNKAKSDSDLLLADDMIGYIMIAFSYSFFYLMNNYTFEDAIRNMLIKGGDTDTNAAIVGGLVGARWGVDRIPKQWINKGIRFDNFRQDYTQLEDVNELEKMIETLIDKANSISK